MTREATRAEVFCAIPARYASVRLPGKPLLELAGKPMIEHVVERAKECNVFDRIVVLTDDERIQQAVNSFGGECELTPSHCETGTDRIAHAAASWSADVIINIQGDEPLIEPSEVAQVAHFLSAQPEVPIATLATRVSEDELTDPNRVKVVCDLEGYALYFSRAPIPCERDLSEAGSDQRSVPVFRHLGIYGYRRSALLRLAGLEPTPLERAERLEQLRALENGMRIRVLEAKAAPIGVDTEADIPEVVRQLEARAQQQDHSRFETSGTEHAKDRVRPFKRNARSGDLAPQLALSQTGI